LAELKVAHLGRSAGGSDRPGCNTPARSTTPSALADSLVQGARPPCLRSRLTDAAGQGGEGRGGVGLDGVGDGHGASGGLDRPDFPERERPDFRAPSLVRSIAGATIRPEARSRIAVRQKDPYRGYHVSTRSGRPRAIARRPSRSMACIAVLSSQETTRTRSAASAAAPSFSVTTVRRRATKTATSSTTG
jgi:hypothetical protein